MAIRYQSINPKNGFKVVLWITLLVATTVLGADLKQAWSLYKNGKYLKSIAMSPQNSDEGIYLIYLNEKEIGWRRSPYSTDPRSYAFLYYRYIQKNPKLFRSNEAAGGDHQPTRIRYEQIKKLKPKSPYLGAIEYEWAVSFDKDVWEDGDGSSHSKELISDYEALIKRFPNAPFVPDARTHIEQVKKNHKRVTGQDL